MECLSLGLELCGILSLILRSLNAPGSLVARYGIYPLRGHDLQPQQEAPPLVRLRGLGGPPPAHGQGTISGRFLNPIVGVRRTASGIIDRPSHVDPSHSTADWSTSIESIWPSASSSRPVFTS